MPAPRSRQAAGGGSGREGEVRVAVTERRAAVTTASPFPHRIVTRPTRIRPSVASREPNDFTPAASRPPCDIAVDGARWQRSPRSELPAETPEGRRGEHRRARELHLRARRRAARGRGRIHRRGNDIRGSRIPGRGVGDRHRCPRPRPHPAAVHHRRAAADELSPRARSARAARDDPVDRESTSCAARPRRRRRSHDGDGWNAQPATWRRTRARRSTSARRRPPARRRSGGSSMAAPPGCRGRRSTPSC